MRENTGFLIWVSVLIPNFSMASEIRVCGRACLCICMHVYVSMGDACVLECVRTCVSLCVPMRICDYVCVSMSVCGGGSVCVNVCRHF